MGEPTPHVGLVSLEALIARRPVDQDLGRVESVVAMIRQAIQAGVAKRGDRLPASRPMAIELNVSRGTVSTAIDMLVAEGLLESRRGAGVYVCKADPKWCVAAKPVDPVEPSRKIPTPNIDAPTLARYDFTPCRPSLELFPVTAWRKCLSDVGLRRPSPDQGDPRGERELRDAIASYMRRARGLDVASDEILITNGAVHAMHLLTSLYVSPQDVVAMEDPGYRLARQIFEISGAKVISIPIDEDGIDVDFLMKQAGPVRLVYVTPSHQFPTGARLSLERRQQLMDWAADQRALVLEDDYDGEFRYDVPPLPPMAAMSNGCVVYCGTFSKTLFPSLRVGYAIAPREIIDHLADLRAITEYQGNQITQLALASLMESGEFERHILRMRRLYARKRKRLRESIEQTGLPACLTGLDSGINALMQLSTDITATELAERAGRAGVCVAPVSRYAVKSCLADDGLVLGYGAVKMEDIDRGITALASVL